MHRLAVGALAGFAALAGCLGEKVTYCSNGAVCPTGFTCTNNPNPMAPSCAPAEELNVCRDKQLKDACQTEAVANGWCNPNSVCTDCDPDFSWCHFGPTWQEMNSHTTAELNGLWVFAKDNVFAIGNNGTVIHYDGTKWSDFVKPTNLALAAIWGSSPSDIFVLASSMAFHYDGSSWSTQIDAPTHFGQALWGVDGANVFGAGLLGMTGRYDGTKWMWADQTPPATVGALWGTNANNVYGAGTNGVVFHYSNSAWTSQSTTTNHVLTGIWGTDDTHITTVGRQTSNQNAPVLVQFDGTWHDNSPMLPATLGMRRLTSVWGSANNDIYVVGDGGALAHYDGTSWVMQGLEGTTLATNLTGIGGVGREVVFAVGVGGTVLVRRP
jgi:hypothetical protein